LELSRRSLYHTSRWRINFVAFTPKRILFFFFIAHSSLIIFLLLFLLQVFDHVFDRHTLNLRKRALAQQKDLFFTLVFAFKKVLVKHAVQLVPKHIKVVDLRVTDRVLVFDRLRL